MTGKQIQTIRLRLGLTQAELAEKLGVTRNSVVRWESESIGIKESAARLLKMLAKESASRKR
ncbi:helix-turn-helix domain-containing protein [Candidatus Binatus sp.]|uniref:helix-turn-helix domain-containing protein n=1 Tax=Candidatus Binatus sp. TaxID=2811406 RepID=UPI003BAF1BC3